MHVSILPILFQAFFKLIIRYHTNVYETLFDKNSIILHL